MNLHQRLSKVRSGYKSTSGTNFISFFFKELFQYFFETIPSSRGSVRIQEYSCTTQNKSLGRLELESSRIARARELALASSRIAHARELARASSRIAHARELALESSTIHLEPHLSVRVPEVLNVTPVMARKEVERAGTPRAS